MGDLGCFSFYPGKNLGAYGEGGAVVTNDPAMARKIRLLRAWGEETRYEHKYRAFNYRMDGIQGAVLGVKLRHLEPWTEARRAHAAEYGRRLAGTPVTLPVERAGRAARVPRLRRAAGRSAIGGARAWPTPACRPACTIRSRCTCSPRIAISGTPRATFPCPRRRRARCCRCRCIPS